VLWAVLRNETHRYRCVNVFIVHSSGEAFRQGVATVPERNNVHRYTWEQGVEDR
jgi:hypothetical protein